MTSKNNPPNSLNQVKPSQDNRNPNQVKDKPIQVPSHRQLIQPSNPRHRDHAIDKTDKDVRHHTGRALKSISSA
jgi:hypothetical protein